MITDYSRRAREAITQFVRTNFHLIGPSTESHLGDIVSAYLGCSGRVSETEGDNQLRILHNGYPDADLNPLSSLRGVLVQMANSRDFQGLEDIRAHAYELQCRPSIYPH